MKGLLILLAVFVLIPVCMGLVSSYRAGVLPYQIRRSERRRKLLEQIEKGHIKPPKLSQKHGKMTTWGDRDMYRNDIWIQGIIIIIVVLVALLI